MKNKTKEYFKNLIDNFEIEANTIDFCLYDLRKSLRKMKKFYQKVVQKQL